MLKVKAIIPVILALFFVSAISFAKTTMTPADIKAFNDAKTLCGCKPSKVNLNFRRALAKARVDAGLAVTPWQEYLAKELIQTSTPPVIQETEAIIIEAPKAPIPQKQETKVVASRSIIKTIAGFVLLVVLILIGIITFLPKPKRIQKQEEYVVLSPKQELNYAVIQQKEELPSPKPLILSPVACDLKLYGTDDYFEQGEKLNDADDYFNRFIRLPN